MANKSRTPADIATSTSTGGSTATLTIEERVQRIQAMGLRIQSCVQFMCDVATLSGSSSEAKEKAISTFYDRIVAVERQLTRIREDFQLE